MKHFHINKVISTYIVVMQKLNINLGSKSAGSRTLVRLSGTEKTALFFRSGGLSLLAEATFAVLRFHFMKRSNGELTIKSFST